TAKPRSSRAPPAELLSSPIGGRYHRGKQRLDTRAVPAVLVRVVAGRVWKSMLDLNRRASLVVSLIVAWAASGTLRADVLITEFLASNRAGIADSDGEFSDWIEIYNSGGEAVELDGCGLSDSSNNPRKWVFPARVIAPRESIVVFASGKDRRDPDGELHTNFKLEAQGEFLALVDASGIPASIFAPRFPEQLPDVSFGPAM